MTRRTDHRTIPELMTDAERLARRLDDGYRKIAEAEAAGHDTAFLEEFWLGLLKEYERVCDAMRPAA